MIETKKFSLVKPTVNTPFHVDFDWWKQHDNNWRVYLLSCLCAEHQQAFADLPEGALVDWIDPETAEVHPVDGLQQILMAHCAREPEFVTSHTALVDAVFRTLLANGNSPMTPVQLSEATGKPADTILKTLASPQIYKGLRPVH